MGNGNLLPLRHGQPGPDFRLPAEGQQRQEAPQQQQGHQNPKHAIDDWFKAYWLNYGTLGNRDPEHHFQTAVKHRKTKAASRRKNAEGIKPRKFFEASIEGWEDTFTEAFSASLKKQEDKLYER